MTTKRILELEVRHIKISKTGEIDCHTPKQFNSLLTQNPFRILEKILSNN